ncbi:unnamed protein product [Lasius platythorax]|uniref:Uncharacterized protein n=1 Tax=Lasius platythorax TaxID=488582 RepID=A0AAV2NV33_9HYME
MSISGTSVECVREKLNQLSLPGLKSEAGKYGIALPTKDSGRWIDAIIDHLLRHDPLETSHGEQSTEAVGEANTPRSSAADNSAPEIFLFDTGSQPIPSDKTLPQHYTLLMEQMRLQREQMSQQKDILQQMVQQQAFMQ